MMDIFIGMVMIISAVSQILYMRYVIFCPLPREAWL